MKWKITEFATKAELGTIDPPDSTTPINVGQKLSGTLRRAGVRDGAVTFGVFVALSRGPRPVLRMTKDGE